MIVVEVKGKNSKEINFPTNSSEITYEQYVEFKWDSNDIQVWLSEQEKSGTLDQNMGMYLSKIATALSNFTGEDINTFYGLPKGDLSKHFQPSKEYKGNSLEKTLLGLYELVFHAIGNHKPKLHREGDDIHFEHNDIKYIFPLMHIESLNGKDLNPELFTGKAIEILEKERIMMEQLNELEKSDKKRAALEYNLDITKVAILSEREGDPFPASQPKIDLWVNKRIKEFEGVKMNVAKDLCFFLRLSTKI